MTAVTDRILIDFTNLFWGRTDAYGTGQGRWVKSPVTPGDYRAHLQGDSAGLGIAPLLDDGTIRFAAIDLDEPDFKAAVDMAQFLPGPSWIERSRSGNAHVWVFFSEPVEAWVVRGILKEAVLAAGKGAVEVFPKQDKLMEGMLGNYINLPFHGGDRPVLEFHVAETDAEEARLRELDGAVPAGSTDALMPDGTTRACEVWGVPMGLEDFTNLARTRLNPAKEWKRRAEWLMIEPPGQRERNQAEFGTQKNLHVCAEWIIANRDENPITVGHRAAVYFALAKMLSNYEGFDHDEALNLLELVNNSSPDPVPDRELARILVNAERGQFTSTDCDNPLVAPFSHPDCPIAHPRSN